VDDQKSSFVGKVNQRIASLHEKIDLAINRALQTELIYTTD